MSEQASLSVYVDLLDKVRREVTYMDEPGDDMIQQIIDRVLTEESRLRYISINDRVHYRQRLFNALRRLDILQPLVDDREVTEIMVNGPHEIFIEKQGRIERLGYGFDSLEQLENVIQSMVAKVNRRVNEGSPVVDARLEDGSRINVVLPPIALKGPTLTIRKFSGKAHDHGRPDKIWQYR